MRSAFTINPKIRALVALVAWSVVGPGVTGVPAQQTGTSQPPEADYWIYVAAESEDEVALIQFGPQGASVEQTIPVGSFPTDIDGPHGIALHPDGSRWYVSIAHGLPYGEVVAYSTETNERVGRVKAGLFPATMAVDPAGLLFVANFNLHGDHVPSSISVIETGSMLELTQIETCTMPHGARLSPDGTMLYSVCMMDDQLVEIDARTLVVNRRFGLAPGREALLAGIPTEAPAIASMPAAGHEGHTEARCSPTWVEAAPDGDVVYVSGRLPAPLRVSLTTRGLVVGNRLVVDQGAQDLFDVERVPFGMVEDALPQILGQVVYVKEVTNQRRALGGGQRREPQVGVTVRIVLPRFDHNLPAAVRSLRA